MRHRRLPLADYVDGVCAGDRARLAQAITLIESRHPADLDLAAALLDAVLPRTGESIRVGITGVPGVGKSTFIDALGLYLVREAGRRVAVLTVDPSSERSGGSLLGDKTRMARLTGEAGAFIRPTAAGGFLGGVAPRTREALLLCEAAGYDTILIETVGVGQSETLVRSMADSLLLLLLAGAGDSLQGMKRGIMEMADLFAITKADGDTRAAADRARGEYAAALRLFAPSGDGWAPPVLTCSALTGEGVSEVWRQLLAHDTLGRESGDRLRRRQGQNVAWLRQLVALELDRRFREDPAVGARLPRFEDDVTAGRTTPIAAARALFAALAG